jgi:hypothetical protein
MDRTVPRTGSEEIELYIRTYYSLLRSTADVQIRTLEEVHASMGSALHPDARATLPDFSAFIYSSLRLPFCMAKVDRIILGQSQDVFRLKGIGDVETWQPATARARRRLSYFNGRDTLACYIASRSDIDDIIPLLTAFQIEWNKLHRLMAGGQVRSYLDQALDGDEELGVLAHGLGVDADELGRLRRVWGQDFWPLMKAISESGKRFKVRLLSSSLNEYRRATQLWWERVEALKPSLLNRPVYFISSNTHSLANLLSGFALRHEEDLLRFVDDAGQADLQVEWHDIEAEQVRSSRENFLYYAFKRYMDLDDPFDLMPQLARDEAESGIHRVPSEHSFDLEAQVFELSKIHPDWVDPRLSTEELKRLEDSQALIVNIDYPLGMAAYLVLAYVATRVGELRGVYILGKAATLNAIVGDVMIPQVVYDEQSQNTYLFDNCFKASDVDQDLMYGTVLDNQKAVSVRGTFLQTPRYMDVFYREGYTDIEMEAGPYLSAIYELARPKRYPDNEIVNLHELPFELGILHYASDTPLSKGRNLGAGTLSYYGMDPTYAASLAALRRIVRREIRRLDPRGVRAGEAMASSGK